MRNGCIRNNSYIFGFSNITTWCYSTKILAGAQFTVTNVRKRKKTEHLHQSLTVLRKKYFKFHVTRLIWISRYSESLKKTYQLASLTVVVQTLNTDEQLEHQANTCPKSPSYCSNWVIKTVSKLRVMVNRVVNFLDFTHVK